MSAEHTPTGDPVAIAAPYLERKQKPDGTWREYSCTLMHHSPTLVVVRFVMARGGAIFGTPISIPPGSVSDGYFWTRRPYNLYRMKDAEGAIIAHRFDAVTDVRIGGDNVSYRDLVLDWWVQPDGAVIEEDRDELEELRAAGKLTARDLERADEAARQVWSRYRHIIDDVEVLERRLAL